MVFYVSRRSLQGLDVHLFGVFKFFFLGFERGLEVGVFESAAAQVLGGNPCLVCQCFTNSWAKESIQGPNPRSIEFFLRKGSGCDMVFLLAKLAAE